MNAPDRSGIDDAKFRATHVGASEVAAMARFKQISTEDAGSAQQAPATDQ